MWILPRDKTQQKRSFSYAFNRCKNRVFLRNFQNILLKAPENRKCSRVTARVACTLECGEGRPALGINQIGADVDAPLAHRKSGVDGNPIAQRPPSVAGQVALTRFSGFAERIFHAEFP